jgi:ATP-binding cassette subfamily B protein
MTDAKRPSTTRRTLHYFWEVTRSQPGMFALAVLSSVGYVVFLTYLNTWLMGLVVDRVAAGGVTADQVFVVFGPYVLWLIVVNVVGQFCSKLQDYSTWKLEIQANHDLATNAFDTLCNQSMTFHANRFGGSLVSQTSKFLNSYSSLMDTFTYMVLPTVASVVFTIVSLAFSVPLYVMILSVFLVVYSVVTYRMYRRILPINAEAAGAQNALSGELSDSVTNILSVKTYGREDYEQGLFERANERVVETGSRRMRQSVLTGATTSSLIVVIMAVAVVFIVGGNAWFGLTAGTLVMMFQYTYSLTMRFNMLSSTMQRLNAAFGDAADMTRVLDEPRLVADAPGARPLVVRNGAIDFEHLNFWYSDADDSSKVFDDFSLHIPAGQHVGLVGRSGAGKTTLTKLLLRLSDIQEGRILVDGQDVSACTQQSLRRQIAYVPQEALLFHRSIRENIAYGRPDASEGDIVRAAREANALEFIEQLPQGFDTLVGERGIKLSGGQRQRVAIARALLADCPVLLLDEATSALDSESERLVQDALVNLMRGRTSIVVAHRLSTVAALDRIVVLDGGHVAEDGTHAELLAEGGEYAGLWGRQTGAFLEA